ncbi:hypothetical protein HQ586_09715 [Candidatus Bathyarchaeota archaeon]|nr:hypothetical protein [Candidatus Bathyarchaeota archaeon]
MFIVVTLVAAYYAVYHSGLLSGVVDSKESGRIEIIDMSCSQDVYENWEVTVSVRSVDDVDFRLSKILVKGMEVSRYRANPPTSKVSTITSEVRTESVVPSGEAAELVIWIGRDYGLLQPTQRVSIRIQDSADEVYTTSVVLSGTL